MFIAYKMTVSKRRIGRTFVAWIIAVVLIVAYGILTFFVPKTPMFMNSNTKGYGIEGFVDHGAHSEDDHDADHNDGDSYDMNA